MVSPASVRILLVLSLWAYCPCFGQNPRSLHFEAASVKPASDSIPREFSGGPGSGDPTRIYYSRVSLKNLIQDAYPEYRNLLSGPPWLESEFTVTATLAPGTTKPELRDMLKTLLAERFLLKFHTTVASEVPGFEIVVDPKGAKLQQVDSTKTKPANPGKPGDGARSLSLPGAALAQNDVAKWSERRLDDGYELMSFKKCSVAYLADRLSYVFSAMKTPVVDRTGISGEFDFQFEYPLDVSIGNTQQLGNEVSQAPAPSSLGRLSPLLEKQLGLKLSSIKVETHNMAIDHLEKMPI